ncbi:MAG: hypothetical protein ACD_15C00204G0028 [uncultured bacterium]|nr:MAG: hypothetical protein ACD_15C00204G0028 [uncultured bacterium]HCU70272.1 hypothetical protein [Candidatus Moranbacteria bacterium]
MKKIGLIFVLSFLLNFIWEISQASLFAPHYVGITGLLVVHLRASLGDIIMISIILMLDILIFGRAYDEKINVQRIFTMAFIGFILAVLVEKYALAAGRWAYNPLMPIVPWLDVGLTPALQMMLTPPAVFLIFTRLKRIL